MFDIIQLKKEGFYTSEYNENLKKPELVKIENPFWYYYNHELTLDQDVALGDVFSSLEPYVDKLEEHFLAETRGSEMKAWFEEIKKNKTEDVNFFEIRLSWCINASIYFDRKANKNDNSLEKYLNFSAMKNSTENESGEEKYDMSFLEIQNLKDVPVVIDKHCCISLWNDEAQKEETIFEFEEGVTLRQFIACLFFQITFFGNPSQAKEYWEQLMSNSIEVDEEEANLKSYTTIKLEWLAEELQEALSVEDYVWAENIRKEIEKVKQEE